MRIVIENSKKKIKAGSRDNIRIIHNPSQKRSIYIESGKYPCNNVEEEDF